MKFSAAAFLATSLISSVSAGYGEPVTGNDPPYYVGVSYYPPIFLINYAANECLLEFIDL